MSFVRTMLLLLLLIAACRRPPDHRQINPVQPVQDVAAPPAVAHVPAPATVQCPEKYLYGIADAIEESKKNALEIDRLALGGSNISEPDIMRALSLGQVFSSFGGSCATALPFIIDEGGNKLLVACVKHPQIALAIDQHIRSLRTFENFLGSVAWRYNLPREFCNEHRGSCQVWSDETLPQVQRRRRALELIKNLQ